MAPANCHLKLYLQLWSMDSSERREGRGIVGSSMGSENNTKKLARLKTCAYE
jgi:hypothetical protein